METVRALPLLGVTPESIDRYSVRLSKVMPHLDPNDWRRDPSPDARVKLYDHLFGYVWPDTAPRRRHTIKGEIVLQFLQVERGVSVYAFMGAFRVGELRRPDPDVPRRRVYEWHDREIMNLHHYVGHLKVRYVRPAGYCGMDYRLSHAPFAKSMLEGMIVEQLD